MNELPKSERLHTDMLAVQKELPKLQKTGINPHFRNKYVPLEELMTQVLPVLNKHNFVLLQQPTTLDGEPALRYRLLHSSGETIEDIMPLLSKNADPQGQGSAITYARRYSLMSLLGLVADEDDDGHKSRTVTVPAQTRPAPAGVAPGYAGSTATAPTAQAAATNPVTSAQSGLITKILSQMLEEEREAFVVEAIGKPKPENSREASDLIAALMAYQKEKAQDV